MALQQSCISIPNSLALIFLQSANLYVCISLQYLIDSVLTWEVLQGWNLILKFYCELIILPNFLLLSALIQDYGSTMALKSKFVPHLGDRLCLDEIFWYKNYNYFLFTGCAILGPQMYSVMDVFSF